MNKYASKITHYIWPKLPDPVAPERTDDPTLCIYRMARERSTWAMRWFGLAMIVGLLATVLFHFKTGFLIGIPITYLIIVIPIAFLFLGVKESNKADLLHEVATLVGDHTLARMAKDVTFLQRAVKVRELTDNEREVVEEARKNVDDPKTGAIVWRADCRSLLEIVDRLSIKE